jgi:hypothetical protein
MNKHTTMDAIAALKETTSTCSNGSACIHILLNIRRYFFSLPGKDHIEFIDIAEDEYGISFDDKSCIDAMQKCTHANNFNALTDVAFSKGFTPSGAGQIR